MQLQINKGIMEGLETMGNEDRPPVVRYRLNVKDSTAGVRTTDLTVEVTGEAVTLQDFLALQREAQEQVDAMYPPPVLKDTVKK